MPSTASACRVPALAISMVLPGAAASFGAAGLTVVAWLSTGCLAEGPPTSSSRGRPSTSTATAPVDPPLEEPFEDAFDRTELGPAWRALSPAWRIEDGRLCAKAARNRGVWLRRTLPRDARIEVTAIGSEAGDLKVELWGDGLSGATGTTYDDATSYLAIFGGWRNARHVLARLDEHGEDRSELVVDGKTDDPRRRPVVPGQPYRFRFERRDGRTLRWELLSPPDPLPGDEVGRDGAGVLMFELSDEEPLDGAGHDHLGFNDWEAPVCFDDLRIVPLSMEGSTSSASVSPSGHD